MASRGIRQGVRFYRSLLEKAHTCHLIYDIIKDFLYKFMICIYESFLFF